MTKLQELLDEGKRRRQEAEPCNMPGEYPTGEWVSHAESLEDFIDFLYSSVEKYERMLRVALEALKLNTCRNELHIHCTMPEHIKAREALKQMEEIAGENG